MVLYIYGCHHLYTVCVNYKLTSYYRKVIIFILIFTKFEDSVQYVGDYGDY
jgi:hypothetical protein